MVNPTTNPLIDEKLEAERSQEQRQLADACYTQALITSHRGALHFTVREGMPIFSSAEASERESRLFLELAELYLSLTEEMFRDGA